MKPGDMVLLIGIDEHSTAYEKGLRIGTIGTIIDPTPWRLLLIFLAPGHVVVEFNGFPDPVAARITHLRLIPPPEKCDFDFDWRRVGECKHEMLERSRY